MKKEKQTIPPEFSLRTNICPDDARWHSNFNRFNCKECQKNQKKNSVCTQKNNLQNIWKVNLFRYLSHQYVPYYLIFNSISKIILLSRFWQSLYQWLSKKIEINSHELNNWQQLWISFWVLIANKIHKTEPMLSMAKNSMPPNKLIQTNNTQFD